MGERRTAWEQQGDRSAEVWWGPEPGEGQGCSTGREACMVGELGWLGDGVCAASSAWEGIWSLRIYSVGW